MSANNPPPSSAEAASKALPAAIVESPAEFRALCPPRGRLIGIDLGTRTIGLALSDETQLIATAMETLARTRFQADAAALIERMTAHRAVGLVLGYPQNLDGTQGPRAQATRAFARNLSRLIATPILLWDERLSTQAAERVLLEADASRRRRAAAIDKLAAAIILQGALDRLGNL